MGIDSISIRTAESGDAPQLAELIGQLGYSVTAEEVVARFGLIGGRGNSVFVAERGGDLLGCLSTSSMVVLHRPTPVGRISMMVVREGLRSTGIGKLLVRHAEAWLAEQGCGMVEVTSNAKRLAAHGFYEALGYEKTSVRLARTLD